MEIISVYECGEKVQEFWFNPVESWGKWTQDPLGGKASIGFSCF